MWPVAEFPVTLSAVGISGSLSSYTLSLGTRSPPNSKRFKTSVPASAPSHLIPQHQIHPFSGVFDSFEAVPIPQTQMQSGSTSRKRRSSPSSGSTAPMAAPISTTFEQDPSAVASVPKATPKKKGRTNTPWTAEEEQRLKSMRDAGRSWSEIAKVRQSSSLCFLVQPSFAHTQSRPSQTFPTRTEGSVKKHWYKVSRGFFRETEYLS